MWPVATMLANMLVVQLLVMALNHLGSSRRRVRLAEVLKKEIARPSWTGSRVEEIDLLA